MLAPGVTVETGYLRDPNGRRYPVDAYGEMVARELTSPVNLTRLAGYLGFLNQLPIANVEAGLRRYLMQLQAYGLASVHQSFIREFLWGLMLWPYDVLTLILSRHLPVRRFASRRQYPPKAFSIVRAVSESYVCVTLAAVAILPLAIVVLNALRPLVPQLMFDRSAVIGLIVAGSVLLILATGMAHELGHLLAAVLTLSDLLSIQARNSAVSLRFRTSSMARQRIVVIAGPAAGVLFAAACACGMLGVWSPDWQLVRTDNVRLTLALVALILMVAQFVSLTPLYADGRSVRLRHKGRGRKRGADA